MRRLALAVFAGLFAAETLADGPRFENIRDQEVREIQSAIAKLGPGELISIGTVVEGCRCDEDGACTDEVRVGVEMQSGRSQSLRMVRSDQVWSVSRGSRWQLDYDKLNDGFRHAIVEAAPADKPALRAEYARKIGDALRARPVCTPADAKLRATPSRVQPLP